MLCSAKFMNLYSSADLARKLLNCSKFSDTSCVDALDLINYKSKSNNFIEDFKCDLRNTICDLYKRNIDANGANFHSPFVHATFAPVKVVKGNNVCCRCDKTFTIRICQHRSVPPNCVQFARKIVGKKFTDHPSVNYLNLLDYSSKAYDFFPSVVTKGYNKDLYALYLPLIVKEIRGTHEKSLPTILPKYITAMKLLDMEDISPVSLSFYFVIIDTILERKYDDPNLLIEIWKSATMSDRFMVCILEKITDHLPDRSNEKLKWVLIMANFLQFDFNRAWIRGHKLRNFSNCPITSTMISGNYRDMKILLDNGFLKSTKFLSSYHVLLRILSRLDNHLARPFERSPVGQVTIVREVLLFLIIRYLQRDDNLRFELIRCLYLLWSSITDPTVTKQQLLDEIALMFRGTPETATNLSLKYEMEVVSNTYDSMIFVKDRTPRSLSHLCRFLIRRSLTLAGTLPHGVIQLRVPKNIQSYLLLTNPEEI